MSRLLRPMSENVTVVTLQSSDVLIRDVGLLNNRVEFQYMFGENCAVQSAGIADVKGVRRDRREVCQREGQDRQFE